MSISNSDKEKTTPSKETFIASSIVLLSERWYGTVSVAEICRHAGFSNGLFYRYFPDKEAIFKHILEIVIDKIADSIADLPGATAKARLELFIERIFNFSQDNPALVKVFREGQYRYFEYERRLQAVYEEGLSRALGGTIDLPTYIFGLGGLRFSAVRSAFHRIPVRIDSLKKIIEEGIFPLLEFSPDRVFLTSIRPLPLEIMPNPRERILRAGKQLIGRDGYFATNVQDITAAAGLATGSFYSHFSNKEAFYAELIHRVGREVRHFISLNLDLSLNRLERELRGLWLFIVFLSLDRNCYGIVREAEFVLPTAVKAYYDAFVAGYRQRVDEKSASESVTEIEFMLGIAHYLGMDLILDQAPEEAIKVISAIGEFYRHGLGTRLG
ncbi:MAG: TetR/AcrR family transcriptional regulator [Rectinemataceae bacterium]|nr:TetR/AcrR family transcriptional regulator [Rectinemataceae bacterium]